MPFVRVSAPLVRPTVTSRLGRCYKAGMRQQHGFTLTEMLIVVIVAAVLAAIAVPNMAQFIKNNARATRINNFVSALNLARSEAIKRNNNVVLCESPNPESFVLPNFPNCNSGALTGQYESGWIVFDDANGNQVVDVNADLIRIFQPDLGGAATLRGVTSDDAAPPNQALGMVTYRGNGFPTMNDGATFTYCDDRGANAARAILFSTTGHPRISLDTDDDGTHEDIDGDDLTCP